MNTVFDYLYTRRASLNYVSPAICQVDFSSSGGPIIVLTPFERQLGPTGFVIGSLGGGRFRFGWNRYPGALCYSVYKLVDELDPFSPYQLIAECINDNFYDTDIPGCYAITAITPEGETPLSEQECTPEVPPGLPPTVTTEAASLITDSAAVLNALANAHGSDTDVQFEWGLTVAYGNLTSLFDIGSGNSDVLAQANINGLMAATTYHFRAIATNTDGSAVGADKQFTTTGVIPPPEASIEPMDLDRVNDVNEAGTVAGEAGGNAVYWDTVLNIIPLPDPSGEADAINDDGVIAGRGNDNTVSAGFWSDGTARDLGNGTDGSQASSVSDDGFSLNQTAFAGQAISYIYDPGANTQTDLGTLGGLDTYVTSGIGTNAPLWKRRKINSSHEVTGASKDATAKFHAFYWVGGVMTDIHPNLPYSDPANGFSGGLYIDETGAIVGQYSDTLSVNRIFLSFGGAPGVDMGGPAGVELQAFSMSKVGQIVCGVQVAGPVFLPFVWDSVNGYVLVTQLAGHGNFDAAYDVNSFRDVVGFNETTAWLYRNGVIYDLSVIAAAIDPDWTHLDTAELVNDSKQIIGFGTYQGGTKAYRMTLPDGSETP